MELLGDADGDLMWSPLRAPSVNDVSNSSGVTLGLWPESSCGSVSCRRSPSPDSNAFPNFERGAAIASVVALGTGRGVATVAVDLQGLLLGDSGFDLEPLAFGGSNAAGDVEARQSVQPQPAQVSMDSGNSVEGGFCYDTAADTRGMGSSATGLRTTSSLSGAVAS